jgi:hypothetical protein
MIRTLCGGVSALLLGLLLFWVEPSGAFEPEVPGDQRTQAQVLFEQARGVLQDGDAQQACPMFAESWKLEPVPLTRFHLALCYEALGRLASAARAFSEVADWADAHGDVELGADARRWASVLEKRASKLRIVVPAGVSAGIQVERDGVLLDVTEWGVEVPVDAGSHQVRAFGDGLVEWSERVEVLSGPGTYTVAVPELASKRLIPRPTLDGAAHSAQAEPIDRSFLGPMHRKVAVVAGSVGVICIGVGSVFALRAISKSDASDRAGCLGSVCPTPAGVELRREAQVAGNVATASMIGGLTGLATAAALFLLVDGTNARAAPSVVTRASAHGGELLWQGRF